MAIIESMLKADDKLKELSSDQIAAIIALSKKDEDLVIGRIHDKYDQDIKALTGIEKPNNTKTYVYLKDAVGKLKSDADNKATTLQSQIDTLKTEKSDLETKLKNNAGDAALKAKNEQLEQTIKDKETALTQAKTNYEKEKSALETKYNTEVANSQQLYLNSQFDQHLIANQVVFKTLSPDKEENTKLIGEMLKYRRDSILQSVVRGTEMVGGKEVPVLRDKTTNEILRDDKLNPHTPGTFLMSKIGDLVQSQRKQLGGGTDPKSGDPPSSTLDLSGVKLRQDAITQVRNYIMQVEGISKQDSKFIDRQNELVKEYKIDEMPTE